MTPSEQDGAVVHPGIDEGMWLDFEGRIRDKRFRVLIAAAKRETAAGNMAAAAAALAEARQLRPDAVELSEWKTYDIRSVGGRASRSSAKRRVLNALMLLVVGVILLRHTDPVLDPGRRPSAPIGSGGNALPAGLDGNPEAPIDLQLQASAPSPVRNESGPPAGSTGRDASDGPRAAAAAVQPPSAARQLDSPFPGLAPVETPDDFVFRRAAADEPIIPAPAPAPAPTDVAFTVLGVAPPPPADAGDASTREEDRVATVLDAYARAYAQLDARAARQVWPSVDERALARAFAGLASQGVDFNDCAIDVKGNSADAACRGTASYVAKVGNDNLRVEPRTWRFQLHRDGETWLIASADVRRP